MKFHTLVISDYNRSLVEADDTLHDDLVYLHEDLVYLHEDLVHTHGDLVYLHEDLVYLMKT